MNINELIEKTEKRIEQAKANLREENFEINSEITDQSNTQSALIGFELGVIKSLESVLRDLIKLKGIN